jgi:hypothetical protein
MNTLQAKGYICGNHEEDFVIGKSYLYNLETCIKSAVVIVPWISKEFLRSPYCMKDLDIACHFYDQGITVMPLEESSVRYKKNTCFFLSAGMETILSQSWKFLK